MYTKGSSPKESPASRSKLGTNPNLENQVPIQPTSDFTKNLNVLNFPPLKPNVPLPAFGQEVNVADIQNYIMFVMNFYEMHMTNLKQIIIQQNDTIVNNKKKIKV